MRLSLLPIATAVLACSAGVALALTAPYMHDGSFKTLKEVVAFYNKGDGELQPLYLEEGDIDAIVAFLESLTGDQDFASPGEARAGAAKR